jgi:L-aspartate oxidase
MALAYEAGAELMDMEFVQFHPTALTIQGAPRFLLSEVLRGEGGVLRNIGLERFMKRYHEAQELAPRDVVARAIVSEMQRTQSTHVYLDMTKKSEEFFKKRFPRIYETCLSYGLDLASDLAPVCPAAHYMMGGVKTDLKGHTSLPGLYAAGETAATGVHGANRLASNSLLEGLVFGAIAGQAMMQDAPAGKRKGQALPGSPAPLPGNPSNAQKEAMKNSGKPSPKCATLTKIRDLMWRDVGIMRNGKDLAEAIKQLEAIELTKCEKSARSSQELRNLHTLALVMARAALAREESRGGHYRSDFPFRNDEDFAKHSALQKGKDVRFEE